jgi:hypothetical protein
MQETLILQAYQNSLVVRKLKRALYALAGFLILSSLIASAGAQSSPISLNFGIALPVPIGQTRIVTVTVKNIVSSTVQLIFVGLRFEWSLPNTFFIGNNSQKGAVLTAAQQIVYNIPVTVPGNVTPGTHRLSAYVTYRVNNKGKWTGTLGGWWVADLQMAYAPTTQAPTSTPTPTPRPSAPPPSLSLETIGALAAVVVIGLFLERRHISRFVSKYRKTKTPTAMPESEKAKDEKPEQLEKKEAGEDR